jgi:uncharacterized repeat protein (TIGR01451 family)
MTNSDTTSSDVQPASPRHRRFRPFVKATFASFVALLGVGLFASPAFAHTNTVSGVAACASGGSYSITWTITNTYSTAETAQVLSVTGGLGTLSTSSGIAIAASKSATITQTLPATSSGTDSISVQGVWPNPGGATNTTNGSVSLPSGCPSITVIKSVAPNTVVAGSSTHVVYTLAIKNTAAVTTTSPITVTDAIPAGTTYVSGSAACGSGTSAATCTPNESAGTVAFALKAGLASQATADVSFAVTANASDPTETIPNTANYLYVGCTPTSTCQSNTVPITVTNTAALTLVKTASTGNVTAGQATPVTYTLAVSNPLSAISTTASSVTVSDVVPSGLTYVNGSVSCGSLNPGSTPSCTSPSYNASTNTVSYTLGAGIAAGSTYPVTFQATVNAADATSIVNTATLTGPGCTAGAPASTCSSTVTITVANFTVSKSDSAGTSLVNPGQVVTYTLAAKNIGTGPGSITVTDVAPAGTTLTAPAPACPAGTTSTCTVSVTGSSISWVISNLAPGATDNLTFAVKVNAGTGGTHILNTGVFTEPGCTTPGGCSTNTTDNPVPPPTTPGTPTTTTTTTSPVTKVETGSAPTAINGATTVHTGEPWAGSTPYVLTALAFGISLLSLGAVVRRRRAGRVPTA